MSIPTDKDFEPVFLKRTVPKDEQIKKGNFETKTKYQASKNVQNKSEIDMRKIDNEEIKLKTAPIDLRKQIQQARTTKKLTRAELAQKCSLSEGIIRDYENGTAIVKSGELAKISKALGVQLKKPKAEKLSSDT